MKHYIVSFVETRRYEMIVRASDEAAAIAMAQDGPEYPVRTESGLSDYEAEELDGGPA